MEKAHISDKIIFLDRDGVINHDSHDYIKSWAEFKFIEGSLKALQLLNQNGFTVILITNQSIINRNMVPLTTLNDIHDRLKAEVKAKGGFITEIFFCRHRPDENCDCRKPKPGLIFKAQAKYDIDLSATIMMGDSAKDIECARKAGCGQAILVQSGLHKDVLNDLATRSISPDLVADNLLDAVNHILDRSQADDSTYLKSP
jgi:D-glycero-D-manno-heptose 1,7-bisphosphate phosphatase